LDKRILVLLLFTFLININPVFARGYEKIRITDFRIELPPETDYKSKQIKNLSSQLDRLYKLYSENKEYMQFARQSDLQIIEDRVVVAILSRPGTTIADIDENSLKAFGTQIQAKAKHSMRVEIPISELENVSTAVREFAEIIPPMRPKEHAVTSEGVALMNADHWQSVGYEGSGIKVAVIDGGFMSLTDAQTNGDIPESYVSHYFSGSGLETGTPHGTAVAEAIFDLVPQAEFYLYKIADGTDFENAIDSCISNGVDIVNHSMGWFNAGGYYDGTGSICGFTDEAIDSGILWVNSAGNSAEDHYRATFTDDGYGYHDFSGTGANVNPIGPNPTSLWYHNVGETIIITLNWDDYPYSDQDYDLYLARYDTIPPPHWSIVASSTDRQTGSSYPEETIVFTNPYVDGMYGVAVRDYSTTSDWDFTFFNLDRSFGYHTNSSSLTDPGTITDVVTVGAINRLNYTSGPQETFSSQGPTTDGRIKPDVAAPDNCNSYAYGYWYGTSLSSPHTAGVCALIKSRYPGYSNSAIRNYLYTDCTVDLGTAGKDNIYGWGKVEMPDFTLTVTSPNGGENFQVDSIHTVTWTSSGTSGGVLIQYSTDSGSSWTDVIASIPDTGAYSWTIPDTPSDSCLIRIADTIGNPADTSDAIFTISPIPYITVGAPNGGENWQVASSHDVSWTSSGTSGGVLIQYSTDSGSSWTDVIASIPDTGAYSWTIPDTPSDSCLVRIADTNGSLADTSNSIFTISPIPYITVGAPNGGEDWQVASSHDVSWTSSGTSGGVLIQYSTDSGSSWADVIASIPDTGAYSWTIPGDTTSDNCLVRIADTNGSLADTSDAIFTISPIPNITVVTPNGGEEWGKGYTYDVTWTSVNTSEGVQIEYSIDSGSTWSDVIASIPDTGAYSWTIPDTTSDNCFVRITDTTGSPSDASDAIFAFVNVTSIPIPELPEVYSFDVKGIIAGNQFDIKYAFPEKAEFKLEVHDIKGTKIKELSGENTAGFYTGKIDMRGKPAGVYFIRIAANGRKFTKINKVVLVK
jgi:hypothetical protein